jgi:hypothetical protein
MPDVADTTRRPDGRIIAAKNERGVLELIRKYGHIRCAEIARSEWSESTQVVAEKMASRTSRRLVAMKQVMVRRNALGGRSYVLARAGVRRLRAWGLDAEPGYDISSVSGPQCYHRTLATRYLVERSVAGHQSFGEYALAKGWAPINHSDLRRAFGKIPDGIVIVPGSERGYRDNRFAVDWIEVESSTKPTKELHRIFSVAQKPARWLDENQTMMLDRVVFVYCIEQGHEGRILRALQRYTSAHGATPELLRRIAFARCDIEPPFVWRHCDEIEYGRI